MNIKKYEDYTREDLINLIEAFSEHDSNNCNRIRKLEKIIIELTLKEVK